MGKKRADTHSFVLELEWCGMGRNDPIAFSYVLG